MNDELKPCPFCGGVEHIKPDFDEVFFDTKHLDDYFDEENATWTGFYVICNDLEGGCGASSGYEHTEEEAIAAWNRRANDLQSD